MGRCRYGLSRVSRYRIVKFDEKVSLWSCGCQGIGISNLTGRASLSVFARIKISENQIRSEIVVFMSVWTRACQVSGYMGGVSTGLCVFKVSEYQIRRESGVLKLLVYRYWDIKFDWKL